MLLRTTIGVKFSQKNKILPTIIRLKPIIYVCKWNVSRRGFARNRFTEETIHRICLELNKPITIMWSEDRRDGE